MLVGLLNHIQQPNGTYTVDWSAPGTIERFRAEEKAWWDQYQPWSWEH